MQAGGSLLLATTGAVLACACEKPGSPSLPLSLVLDSAGRRVQIFASKTAAARSLVIVVRRVNVATTVRRLLDGSLLRFVLVVRGCVCFLATQPIDWQSI